MANSLCMCVALLMTAFFGFGNSAPVDNLCVLSYRDPKEWDTLIHQILQCIESAVDLKSEQRENFMLSLAQSLADVAMYNSSILNNQTLIPFDIPLTIEENMNSIIFNGQQDVLMVQTSSKVLIININRGRRYPKSFYIQDNSIILGLIAALAFLLLIAIAEMYISWNKFLQSRKVRHIVRCSSFTPSLGTPIFPLQEKYPETKISQNQKEIITI